MKHPEITNIEELKELMVAEAEQWGRTEMENRAVNGKGIDAQWQTELEKDGPLMHIFAMIYEADTIIERPDGSNQEGVFNIEAFWFNEEGERKTREDWLATLEE